jgi:hypothetical protein
MVCFDCASEKKLDRDIAALMRDGAQEAAAMAAYRT